MNKGDYNSVLSNMIKKGENLQPKCNKNILCYAYICFHLRTLLLCFIIRFLPNFINGLSFIPVSPKFEYGLCPLNTEP